MTQAYEFHCAKGPNRSRLLSRLKEKPTLEHWGDHDALSVAEAVALDITGGILSEKGLRTAIDNGQLAFSEVAGKFFITKHAVSEMFTPKLRKRSEGKRDAEVENVSRKEKPPHVPMAMAKIAAEKSTAARRRLMAFS